jgi:hypothetical protein
MPTYLVDAATGKILRTLVHGLDFAQGVFADNWLFTANADGVYAWGAEPPPEGPARRCPHLGTEPGTAEDRFR